MGLVKFIRIEIVLKIRIETLGSELLGLENYNWNKNDARV